MKIITMNERKWLNKKMAFSVKSNKEFGNSESSKKGKQRKRKTSGFISSGCLKNAPCNMFNVYVTFCVISHLTAPVISMSAIDKGKT